MQIVLFSVLFLNAAQHVCPYEANSNWNHHEWWLGA